MREMVRGLTIFLTIGGFAKLFFNDEEIDQPTTWFKFLWWLSFAFSTLYFVLSLAVFILVGEPSTRSLKVWGGVLRQYIVLQGGLVLLCGTLAFGFGGVVLHLGTRRWGKALLSLTVWLPLWGSAFAIYVGTVHQGRDWLITLLNQMRSAITSFFASEAGLALCAVVPVFFGIFMFLVGIPFLLGGKKAVQRWLAFWDRPTGNA